MGHGAWGVEQRAESGGRRAKGEEQRAEGREQRVEDKSKKKLLMREAIFFYF